MGEVSLVALAVLAGVVALSTLWRIEKVLDRIEQQAKETNRLLGRIDRAGRQR